MTAVSNATRARAALSYVSPTDVDAMTALEATDPVTLSRLVSAVAATVAASPMGGLDSADVVAVAALRVARSYVSLVKGDRSAPALEAHAVARAVADGKRAAHAVALERVAGDVSLEVFVASDAWELRTPKAWTPDPLALLIAPERVSRAGALVSSLPLEVVEAWQAIAGAWTNHNPDACDRCAMPGARPSRLTLSSIRAHVSGLESSAARRMREADGATVALVGAAVAPVLERAPLEAWALSYVRPRSSRVAGNADPATVRREVPVTRAVRATGTAVSPGPLVPVAPERVALVNARRGAAWESRESARVARVAARTAESVRRGTAENVAAPAGRAVADPYGRRVPVAGGSAWTTAPGGLPAWVHGPIAPAASEPAPAVESGRMAGTARTVPVTVRALVSVDVVDVAPIPSRGRFLPDVDAVTVRTADGARVTRALTPAESAALGQGPAPVEHRDGFGHGDESRTGTAPASDGDRALALDRPTARDESGAVDVDAWKSDRAGDRPVRAFKAPVSPRKRAGDMGPSVPVRVR